MPFEIENLPEAIRQVKKDMRRALPNYAEIFRDVESETRRKVAQIGKEREAGEPVIPTVPYSEIADGAVSPQMTAKIKDRDACVIRMFLSPNKRAAGMTRIHKTDFFTADPAELRSAHNRHITSRILGLGIAIEVFGAYAEVAKPVNT
jgi:hypothetical protein